MKPSPTVACTFHSTTSAKIVPYQTWTGSLSPKRVQGAARIASDEDRHGRDPAGGGPGEREGDRGQIHRWARARTRAS